MLGWWFRANYSHKALKSSYFEAVVELLGDQNLDKTLSFDFILFLPFLVSCQVTDLEEIHKKVLSSQDSATREATAVRRALAAVYEVMEFVRDIGNIS